MPLGSNSDVIADAAERADVRLGAAIADFFLPDGARLDDQVRAALRVTLYRLVEAIETDFRGHAARLLASRGHADAAQAMLAAGDGVLPLLSYAGLLRDPELMHELIARSRSDLIEEGLPLVMDEANRPSLLIRLIDHADAIIASAAHALLAAESARGVASLPAELQHRLIWWIAAAVRRGTRPDPDVDGALVEAAQRCLLAHDEGGRVESAAERLVAAIDPPPGDMSALLVEAMGDRRLTLVVALLARSLAIDGDVARSLVIEPADERLWIGLRAAGLSREQMARVALSLAEADPGRDIEAFADRLDDFMAITPASAREVLAPLSLPRDLRLAVRALSGERR